jgi:hypothetical protein
MNVVLKLGPALLNPRVEDLVRVGEGRVLSTGTNREPKEVLDGALNDSPLTTHPAGVNFPFGSPTTNRHWRNPEQFCSIRY